MFLCGIFAFGTDVHAGLGLVFAVLLAENLTSALAALFNTNMTQRALLCSHFAIIPTDGDITTNRLRVYTFLAVESLILLDGKVVPSGVIALWFMHTQIIDNFIDYSRNTSKCEDRYHRLAGQGSRSSGFDDILFTISDNLFWRASSCSI